MSIFSTQTQENRVKCGRCGTEFDLNKNKGYCPLCGFGKKEVREKNTDVSIGIKQKTLNKHEFLSKPPSLNLKSGKVISNEETGTWGSWLMFNDFFAPKFLTRLIAWKMHKENKDFILLKNLMNDAISLIKEYNLSKLKGFPNLKKDAKGSRLVYHFLQTFVNIGLVEARTKNLTFENIWKEKWENIEVSLTKEGLEFAQIRNKIFDEEETEQTLTQEEKNWLINYLKQIDKKGYKEYSILKEVYEFLKAGNNGNKDLWNWFENNEKFKKYILRRSKRAERDEKVFKKQLYNYARSFASAKISLLRELGVVKDKRNDYTIIGDYSAK